MPQIFYCDAKKFEHLYEEILLLLPEKRREKAEKFFKKEDKLLSAISALLVIKAFGKEAFECMNFGEHGKPFFEYGECFSISHSGRIAMLAVSKEDIGIDVECRKTANEKIAERCFTEEEQAFSKTSTEAFFRIWTAKEAVLKILGTGFSYSPKNFSVLPLDEEHRICGKDMRFYCGNIEEFPFTAAYSEKDDNFVIREVLPEELIY